MWLEDIEQVPLWEAIIDPGHVLSINHLNLLQFESVAKCTGTVRNQLIIIGWNTAPAGFREEHLGKVDIKIHFSYRGVHVGFYERDPSLPIGMSAFDHVVTE